MATRDDSLAILEATGPALRRLTGDLDDAALDFRPSSEAWSIREALAHLVDDEAFIMRQRLARIVKEERPELAPHDEKRWYASRNTARDARDELLADFQAQRIASLGVARLLSSADWQRVGFQPEYGEFTAEGWLERWADHDNVHLNQIEQTLFAYQQQQHEQQQASTN
ncbi:MAG TPA: DinB family protein [Ktedonobacterales bacterium]|nr:DinB family protein [Ktedonobacterales bacterium]